MQREAFVTARGQFGRPRGVLGWIAGRLMAHGNEAMNRAAFELLDVQPTDYVLEVGFGPGRLITRVARRATEGLVAGVDLSEVMVRQAARRNRAFIRDGRVELEPGGVSGLRFPDGQFTKVCAVNSLQFWPAPVDDLREVRRVMRYGGRLVLGLRMRGPGGWGMATAGFTADEVDEVRQLVRQAGFRDVRTEVRRLPRETATYIGAQC